MSSIGSDNGWLEAAIAWEVCASLHRQYCKGKDALFTTRQSDFVKHAENARGRVAHGQAPAQPDPAYSAACSLATALFKKHFAHLPDFASGQAVWSLCDSTAGVILQIDNMVSGLVQPPTQTQPAPATQQDPAGWYVTGCSRLLDEDEAKAEARHIGGTARAIPLYTAPQPSPTAQAADSQPAPVRDYPPLPDFDSGDEPIWNAIFNWKTATPGSDAHRKANAIESAIINQLRAYVDADRAARVPAGSVQEDAARLDFLIDQRAYVVSDPDTCTGHWLHWARPDGSTRVQGDEHPTPRAAIDAAMNKGGAT